jgi:RNA polymerase sigma-70 factor (ECF subfamily)
LAPPPFNAIYRQYFSFVWASAKRFGVRPEFMDDVVQEVFIVIHAKVHTLEKPEALRSWIYGVVRRTVSDHHSSQRSRPLGTPLEGAVEARLSDGATPLHATERTDRLALLERLLDELGETKREVFVLAELHEMTAPEIADALGIPLNTAYSRLRAARQEFDEALARHTAREERFEHRGRS